MTTEDQYKMGDFCWIELCSSQIDKAIPFYESLMGWQANTIPMPEGDPYTMFQLDDSPVGGAFKMPAEMSERGVPPHWNAYVLVDNIDEMTSKAKTLGAVIIKEPFDVMEMGRMSVIQDTTGAVVKLWQSNVDAKPTLSSQTPGNFGWFELSTTDLEKSTVFYTSLFNWKANQEQVGSEKLYTTFMNGDKPVAGMIELTEEMKGMYPHWEIYFTVANCNETIEKAKSMGAALCYPPLTIPNVGQFTMLQDPEGVCFSILQYPEA